MSDIQYEIAEVQKSLVAVLSDDDLATCMVQDRKYAPLDLPAGSPVYRLQQARYAGHTVFENRYELYPLLVEEAARRWLIRANAAATPQSPPEPKPTGVVLTFVKTVTVDVPFKRLQEFKDLMQQHKYDLAPTYEEVT